MRIYHSIADFQSDSNPVVTVGVFDGVHSGHREILRILRESAIFMKTESVVITFDPHPRLVLGNASVVQLLQSLSEKTAKFEEAGVDSLLIIPFNREFAGMDPEFFIRSLLVDQMKISKVITGYDHFFGQGRAGDFTLLSRLGKQMGFEVKQVAPVEHCGQTVSSSAIRAALLSGDTKAANCMLGYIYSMKGKVVRGNQIGKLIGFPTANLQALDVNKLIPANGVYASLVEWNGKIFQGMSNIGVRPTIEANHLTVEVNIFDFNEEIYNDTLTLSFIERIRDEKRFGGLEQLKDQLLEDRVSVLHILQQLPQ